MIISLGRNHIINTDNIVTIKINEDMSGTQQLTINGNIYICQGIHDCEKIRLKKLYDKILKAMKEGE